MTLLKVLGCITEPTAGVMSVSSFSWWGRCWDRNAWRPSAHRYLAGVEARIVSPAKIISPRFDPIPVE